MRHLSHHLIAGLLTCLVTVTLASGQHSTSRRYTITDLGTLGNNTYSEGLSVNLWGHVVGCSGEVGYVCDDSFFPFADGFVWTETTGMRAIKPLPGGTIAYATAINDSDWIAGTSSGTFQGQGHATLWKSNGEILDLGTLDSRCYDTCNSYAKAVNDAGVVVGDSYLPTLDILHAFLWTEGSGMIDLGTLGFDTSSATAVNLRGGVAGYLSTVGAGTNAFLWTRRDGLRDLGTLKGATSAWSIAFGINDLNEVVGQSAYAGGDDSFFHAFLWTEDQGMQDLGVAGGLVSSEALAINDRGEIVGWLGTSAFIWTRAEGMQNLNDCIDPNSGWTLNSANAINILGQITGSGTINGETHAFLLTPQY